MARTHSGWDKLALGTAAALVALPLAYFSAVAEDGKAPSKATNFIQSLLSDDDELIDASQFVRMDRFDGHLSVAGYVDTNALSTAKVTKIGYGRSQQVNITTTSTGTYSSDGLFSAHVQYPGVKLVPKQTKTKWPYHYWHRFQGILVRTHNGYFSIPNNGTPSYRFLFHTPKNGLVSMTPKSICTHTSQAVICN